MHPKRMDEAFSVALLILADLGALGTNFDIAPRQIDADIGTCFTPRLLVGIAAGAHQTATLDESVVLIELISRLTFMPSPVVPELNGRQVGRPMQLEPGSVRELARGSVPVVVELLSMGVRGKCYARKEADEPKRTVFHIYLPRF